MNYQLIISILWGCLVFYWFYNNEKRIESRDEIIKLLEKKSRTQEYLVRNRERVIENLERQNELLKSEVDRQRKMIVTNLMK